MLVLLKSSMLQDQKTLVKMSPENYYTILNSHKYLFHLETRLLICQVSQNGN